MELRRISILWCLIVVTLATVCSEARTHSLQRRDTSSEADANYDDTAFADAAADEDAQNDAGDDDYTSDAHIKNTGTDVRAGVGKVIRLPCVIEPTPISGTVDFQWMKDGQIYFLGSMELKAPKRMSIDKETGSDLIITNLQPEDSGEYMCTVTNEPREKSESIKHIVRVEMPPKIIQVSATDNGRVIEGTDVHIICAVSGLPPPKLIWSREGPSGENRGLTEEDGEFTANSVFIRSIKREQAGKYLCYADNKVGNPVAESINIKVLGKPRVHVHKTVVNSDLNVEAILQCSAHEEPEAHIRWYKDDMLIEDSTNQFSVSTNRQKSNLTVTPTSASDFGTFTCEAENMYGKHNRSIELVQTPVVEDLDVDGTKLTWTVRSHQPVEQMQLQLREIGGEGNTKTLSVPVPEHKNHGYEVVYVLDEKEISPGNYEALINAKNIYDWSGDTEPALVKIEAQPMFIQHASVYRSAAQSMKMTTSVLSTIMMYLLIRLL